MRGTKERALGLLRQRAIDIAFKEPRKYDNELASVHWMDAGVHEGINAVIDALAESKDVIVIGAEVEHKRKSINNKEDLLWTEVFWAVNHKHLITLQGHLGTPGPYVLFGVPKPKESRKP